jgi:hypothetical protein
MLAVTALGVILSPIDQYPGISFAVASVIVGGIVVSIYSALRVSRWYWLSIPLGLGCLWVSLLSLGH